MSDHRRLEDARSASEYSDSDDERHAHKKRKREREDSSSKKPDIALTAPPGGFIDPNLVLNTASSLNLAAGADRNSDDTETWISRKDQKRIKRDILARKRADKLGTHSAPVEYEEEVEPVAGPQSKASIFEQLVNSDDPSRKKSEAEKMAEEEKKLLEVMTQDIPLQSVADRAHGVIYTEALTTSWSPPKWALNKPQKRADEIRQKLRIDVDGEDVPPPLIRFEDFKFPRPMIEFINSKGITKPTPIQIQGLPVVLKGRDMIGVAFTGSGKTIVFALPLVTFALEEELKMPITSGEGPFGLVLCPSRELAVQTFEVLQGLCDSMAMSGYPSMRVSLLIGGQSLHEQESKFKGGVHLAVATPGRLIHFLNEKRINMNLCKMLVLDEADRLIDMGFEEDIRTVMDFFKHQRQTILFSATMPKTIQNFARSALVKPIEVNVGRAGAASLDVIQEVEFVAPEAKIVYLLECLQKTAPPVIIFCENKADVDDIHEYLLLKGVDAAAIHGGKDQEEREEAVRLFKAGVKDVLVATDVASKGLDFPNIQHVINYDMPKEVENYVHRIGRTGRGGKTGVATTFVNKMTPLTTLLDLKSLLVEAKQKIPQFLADLDLEEDQDNLASETGVVGCAYCGGLGHRIGNCPKLEQTRMKTLRGVTSGGSARERGGGGY